VKGKVVKKSKEIDMTHGKLLGKLIVFVIPVILSGVLQLLFNAADIIVVGRYAGDHSLAAVGSTSSLINLMVSLFMGLSIGANVIAAQYYGSGERQGLSATVHTSFMVSIICGIALAIVGVVFSTPILELMGSPDDVIGLASLYLRIYFLAMPATLIYNFGAAILRASGDTRTPLYFLSAAGVINVLLNLLLVIKFNLDVAGVGIATVVSQYISAALILIHFMRQDGDLHFSFKKLGIDKGILGKIIRIGIPAGIQGTVFSLSNVVIQSAINSFGSTIVAANSAASNIEGFVYIAMNSVYQTAITFVGQNYGAGKYKRVLKVLLECLGIVLVIGLVLGNSAYAFGENLLHIYSSNPEVIAAGMVRIRHICTIYFLCGMMDTMVGALRGIGKSVLPMIVSLTGACALRLVWIATVFQLHKTPEMLYLAYPITWIITLCAHIICFVVAYRHILKTHHAAE
jgi:putative MATE family efflux protein